ncbi:cobalamin-dependent protein [Actinospica sp. MGRD01-02]|uniref:Cobalamin-dependent protein n=1 Tax=Actinospica acidithermotolerans TaxID=2828514 RepID=A0A941E2M4_9ACTN|nr:cobalamin-dependent protein [Actinospica acidithermotolerans]MBR7825020.1 cobalamin-dependent protein [Actinospica acidithermotolerans]
MHQAAEQTATALPAPPRQTSGSADGVSAEQRQAYWDALIARDERTAWGVTRRALEDGVDPECLLLDLIGGAQRRIGTDWAAARLSVAQEHAATAIGDRVVAALAAHPGFRDAQAPAAGRVAVACADGEWHAMPARLLAEVLALRGWQVDFLGAHVPGPHLVAHLHQSGPDAVALSASLATRLPAAHAVITACQAAGVPVLAGGAAFGPDGRHARLLNADGWAGDARAAAESLQSALPRPRSPHQAVDDLPHLSDQEYTLLRRGRLQFAAAILADLPARFPRMRDYSESQMRHTEQDIDSILEYLACATYVDDAELFVAFSGWTREILQARGVPDHALTAGLEAARDRLREFPRAAGFLTAALEDLKEDRR